MNPQHLWTQLILRSWPFPRGAGRILDRCFPPLAFDNDIATVRTSDGFMVTVLPNELIGRHLYLIGEFDRTTVEVLLKFSKPGDVLLDIGANIGYIAACFLYNVRGSRAIAVEPQPKIVDLLESNLKQFGSDRYRVFPVGLSDKDSVGWLEICNLNRGASKLVDEQNSNTVPIQIWSAKRLFASLQGTKVDLVKIDVEGQEEAVLTACQAELSELRPRAIFFENHNRSAAADGPIGRIFEKIGYRVLGVKKKLTRLEFVSISAAGDCVHNDYLAIPTTEIL